MVLGGVRVLAAPLPAYLVILSSGEAAGLLHQCSRQSIASAQSYWQPSDEQIFTLESTLRDLFNHDRIRKPPKPLTEYYRQYVGVVSHGKRLIYGNFFPKSDIDEMPPEIFRAMNKSRDLWRKKPYIVCDGGPAYWGIVYDVETRSFDEPRFNGRL